MTPRLSIQPACQDGARLLRPGFPVRASAGLRDIHNRDRFGLNARIRHHAFESIMAASTLKITKEAQSKEFQH
jgi:hypothetical protein